MRLYLSESKRADWASDLFNDIVALELYAGPPPSTPGDKTGLTLQVNMPLASPIGTLSGSVITLTPGVEGVRVDNQTITIGHFVDASGAYIIDADVSLLDGDGTVKLRNVDGAVGAIVRLTSGVFGL